MSIQRCPLKSTLPLGPQSVSSFVGLRHINHGLSVSQCCCFQHVLYSPVCCFVRFLKRNTSKSFTQKRQVLKSSRILSLTFLEKVELKMYHGNELLSTIYLSGHTTRFHPQTQRQNNWYSRCNKQGHREALYSSFYLSGHIVQFHPPTQFLEPPSYLSNRPHFLWVYRRDNPRGMLGEHSKSL